MAPINFTKLALANSDDQFLAAIDSIQRRGHAVQLDIHLFLVAVASRWASTGDVRPAVGMVNKLIEALPHGVRSNAIKAWVETHLGFVWTQTDLFQAGTTRHADLSIKTLANVRWWEFKPEPAYKPMDFAAALLSLTTRADDRLQKPDPRDVIDAQLLRIVKGAASGKAIGFDDLLNAVQSLNQTERSNLTTYLATSQGLQSAA
ncbi:hypothetical protein SAMN04488523_102107 [Sulfitobacter brevis]|uniref:Uncharacterized protein n=1 Tax=Sulfitobacter brevis TaxID=74348 RepID=A0A1I1ULQ7_9RHOB|nr:hypothetical protein [Sulfitobacter brevis]SFD69683.1 hypothetical protein SAMN04488523_102107 [Sulfitobacter brevis]